MRRVSARSISNRRRVAPSWREENSRAPRRCGAGWCYNPSSARCAARIHWIRRMGKHLFGTDGIRGIPGEPPLDDSTLIRVGMALGKHLWAAGGAGARVLIGRDTRESGPHIAQQIACGLAAAGAEPVSAGVLTTPGVAWLVHREGFSAGVVISASHNPYHDNGVKLIASSGMKFPDAVEADLERVILSLDAPASLPKAPVGDGKKALHRDYLEGLRAAVLPGANLAGMKIV